MVRRSAGWIGVLLMVVLLAPGTRAECEKDPDRYVLGSRLTFVERDPVDVRCYYCATQLSDEHFANLVYLPLVKPEPDTREPMPALAARWSENASEKTITFTLRPGLRWSSGHPIAVRDILATFNHLTGRGCARQAYREFAERIASIEDLGGGTVRFRFKNQSDAVVAFFYQYPILPADVLSGHGLVADGTICTGEGGVNLSSGPYLLSSIRGTDLVFDSNPLYLGGGCEPYVSQMRMHVVGDRSAWPSLLETRAVDLLIDVPVRYTLRFMNDREFKTKVYGFLSCVFVAFNQDTPLLRDLRVRQAMTLAYDRRRILGSTFAGRGEVLASPLGAASRYHNRDVEPVPYDPDRARELLFEAGLRDVNGDNMVEAFGKDVVFDLVVPQSLFLEYEPAIEFFRSAMRNMGITIELRLLDDNEVARMRETGRGFDLMWGRWEFIDGVSVLRTFESGHDDNFVEFEDDHLDAILERALRTDDLLAYSQYIRSAQVRLAEQLPFMFLWSLDHLAVHTSRVQGLTVSAYNFFDYIDEAYVSEPTP